MTLFIDGNRSVAFYEGRARAEVIRARKKVITPGDVVVCRQGSWGSNGPVLATAIVKSVRPVTRLKPGKWAYGYVANHMSLSELDLRLLAEQCGFESASAMDKKFAKVTQEERLIKVVW